MKLYKLTDENGYTYNGTCKWGEGVTNSVEENKKGKKLCSSEVIHAYTDLNLGILLNPIHANYNPFRIYEAEGEIKTKDWGKMGIWKLTTTKELTIPQWYRNENTKKRVQIQFAILCAESVLKYFEDNFPNDDRPKKAIQAAKNYLKNPTSYIAYAAANAAYDSDAAYAAADSICATNYAAAAFAASDAAYAVCAALDAAPSAAAYAAANAAYTDNNLDFVLLANKAIKLEENNGRNNLSN